MAVLNTTDVPDDDEDADTFADGAVHNHNLLDPPSLTKHQHHHQHRLVNKVHPYCTASGFAAVAAVDVAADAAVAAAAVDHPW